MLLQILTIQQQIINCKLEIMHTSKTTVLSQSIQLDSKVQSIQLTPHLHQLYTISHKLANLNHQKQYIKQDFQAFKDDILLIMNRSMGKISSLIHRQIQTKCRLERQLSAEQNRNQKMKKEVLQLREMIEQFIRHESEEVELKDREIDKLKKQIQHLKMHGSIPEKAEDGSNLVESQLQEAETFQKSYYENNDQSLEIIQEVTEYTASVTATPSLSTVKGSLAFLEADNNAFQNRVSVHFQKKSQNSRRNSGSILEQQNRQEGGSSKKVKKYLNFFRQQIDENTHTEEFDANNPGCSSVSSTDNLHLGDTDKVNLPNSIKSPRKMEFIKKESISKKAKSLISEQDKQNNFSCLDLHVLTPHSSKTVAGHQRNKSSSLEKQRKTQHRYEILISQSATKQRRSSKDSRQSNKDSDERLTRSNLRTTSKQKIKVTSKMIEQENTNYSIKFAKKPLKLRPSVHLGGKAHMKKLAKQIRVALQQLKIWEGDRCKEVRYDGERKNNMRWGKGRLIFDNGFTYEGQFVQNYRHGQGKIFVNGIQLYDGQWCLNEFSGEGYIKSLKNLSDRCPKILHEASYCGQLLQNKLHGMGTLFINQNEKFVGKFVHGVPVGEYTYYNHSDIQFGNWF